MKLLFSEAKPDYPHYVFPFAVWAFPDAGEAPSDLFGHGFLPSSPNLDRFYMCRHVRVALQEYKASSENRRILRKGNGLTAQLVPREEFELTPSKRHFIKQYAETKFGRDVMSDARLDRLFSSRIVTHILSFTDKGSDVGYVTLYIEPSRIAYYYYAFYDLAHLNKSLGLFMMTSAVERFAEAGLSHLYLGTCYSRNALYKTQFAGAQFFNGAKWSSNLEELKFLIARQEQAHTEHLWENAEFRQKFYPEPQVSLQDIALFHVEQLPCKLTNRG
ncbi:MAG TPA: hypothetical protein VEH27_08320 [Methylomirabilota bacterium]|nr:hypothetical protein [Methylomirabilota bacterium]